MEILKIIFCFVYFVLEINILLGFNLLDKEVMFDKLVEIIDTEILLVADKIQKNVMFQPPVGSSLENIFRNRLDLFIGVPKEILMSGLDLEDGDFTTVNQSFLSCLPNTTRVNNSLSSVAPTAMPSTVESVSTECQTTENTHQNNTNTTTAPDSVAAVTVALQTNITATTIRQSSSIPSTTSQPALVNRIKNLSGINGIDGLADGRNHESTATTTPLFDNSSTVTGLLNTEIVRSTVSPKRTHRWGFGDNNMTMTTVVTPPVKIYDSHPIPK